MRLTLGDVHHPASIMADGAGSYLVAVGQDKIEIAVAERGDGNVRFTVSGLQQSARFALSDGLLHLDLNGVVFAVRDTALDASGAERRDGGSRLIAPMNGAIIAVHAQVGDRVAKGQPVVVLEAMKMQHEIAAERDGVVDKVLIKPGDQVATRQLLVQLKQQDDGARQRAEETR